MLIFRYISLFKRILCHCFSFFLYFPCFALAQVSQLAKETWCAHKPKITACVFRHAGKSPASSAAHTTPGSCQFTKSHRYGVAGGPGGCREGNQPCVSRVPVCRELGGTGCVPWGTEGWKTSSAARWGHNRAFVCRGGKEGGWVRRMPWGGLPGGRQAACDALPGAELLPSTEGRKERGGGQKKKTQKIRVEKLFWKKFSRKMCANRHWHCLEIQGNVSLALNRKRRKQKVLILHSYAGGVGELVGRQSHALRKFM